MTATNVANGKKKVVYYHNSVPYLMNDSEKCPYYVLDHIVKDYCEYYEYSYWKLDNQIYTGYYTNSLNAIQEKDNIEQLTLF